MRLAKRGLGLAEVVVASAILGICVIPLLTMSSQAVNRANEDRARLIALTLCNNAQARFAGRSAELATLLTQSGNGERYSDDILGTPLGKEIGGDAMAGPIAGAEIVVILHARPAVVPGAGGFLVVESRFKVPGRKVKESVFLEQMRVAPVTP